MRPTLGAVMPSPSGMDNILRRQGQNRLTPRLKEAKRRIVTQRAGELGHADVHHLAKRIIADDNARYYLVGVIDAHTRVAWAELVRDARALSVMFAAMRALTVLRAEYGVQFTAILTDNGSEFCARGGNKMTHPFERLLLEGGIRHRTIRPYRPQTNGKIERFWRTLEDELLADTEITTSAGAINGQIPAQAARLNPCAATLKMANCQRID